MSGYDYEDYVIIYDRMREDGLYFAENAFEKDNFKCVPVTIDKDIFKDLDYSPCIGYANLENREEGVYARCTFNGSELAKLVKHLIQKTDNLASSVEAGGIRQDGHTVVSGYIRSVLIIPRDKLLRYIWEEAE